MNTEEKSAKPLVVPEFTAAEFIEGRNEKTDAHRERYCKGFCRFRKKHKCGKHGCRIINAPCDPIAEYLKQKEEAEQRAKTLALRSPKPVEETKPQLFKKGRAIGLSALVLATCGYSLRSNKR